MKPLCIYHSPCLDGFAAAAVVYKYYQGEVDLHPGVHGEPPPDVTDREVLIVDFSYKRPVLLEMAKQAKSITIFDHHASAERDLIDLPENVRAVFDMNRSGGMMTWDELFPGERPPGVLEYVQDRDLWRFNLPQSKEVNLALFSYPYNMDLWQRYLNLEGVGDIGKLQEEGTAILRKHNKDIEEYIANGIHRLNIAGFDVPALNCPYQWGSDAGHIMCQGEWFAAYWYMKSNGKIYIGFRSEEGGEDVSVIATQFGGGGHKHASGCEVDFETFQTFLP